MRTCRVARHLVKQFGQGRGKDINAPIHEAETVQHAVDYVLTHIKVDLACRTVRDLHEALTGEKKPKASRPLNFQRPGVRSCGRPGVGPARAFSPLLDPRSAQIPNCAPSLRVFPNFGWSHGHVEFRRLSGGA
jgi:hypothetical protein